MIGSHSLFIKQAKNDMPKFIKKAIDDLLEKLDSKIEYPKRQGKVIEARLLKVVQSREEVYLSICELMDEINISQSNDTKYKKRIIQGMITTWHELTEIIKRDIGATEEDEEDNILDIEGGGVSDDHLSSISKSKVIASKLAKKIIDRIALLDDPDAVNDDKLKNVAIDNIIEQYAESK